MNTISFGKYVPVRVFVDGKEVKTPPDGNVPKPVERVTLTMCDCLIKDKNYPDTSLAEQQRRFFASQVPDYRVPRKCPQNKTQILPSSVKTANIEGRRYLVTGDDIYTYKEYGHQLGSERKRILQTAEQRIGEEAVDMSRRDYNYLVDRMTRTENDMVAQDRINRIKQDMRRNNKITDKTLYINAVTNPSAKYERDKYIITLIDFKA